MAFGETRSGGQCAQGYTLVRTWTARDACGNESSRTQTLTVAEFALSFLGFPRRPEETAFMFSGAPGQRFTLDRSTNAVTWSPGPVLEIDRSGRLIYHDPRPNSPIQQFFRTRVQP